jgi:hypothetical protein
MGNNVSSKQYDHRRRGKVYRKRPMPHDPGVQEVMSLAGDAEKRKLKYRRYRQEVIDGSGKCSCGNTEWLRLYHPDDILEALYKPDNRVVLCRGCHMKEYASKDDFERSGKGFTVHLKITTKTIAESAGRCTETVRRHINKGNLDPNDLDSIHEWLRKHRRKVCK